MTGSSAIVSLFKDHCSLSLSLSLCVMMASSEPVATVVIILNHAASHLKTVIPMELIKTVMILFLLIEALGT
jgi:hypothetical protein